MRFDPPGSNGADFSANQPTPPVLGAIGSAYGGSGPYAAYVLITVVPGDYRRFCIEVDNTSGAQVAIVRDDGKATPGNALTNASVFALTGGVAVGAQGAGWVSPYFKGRLQVYAPSSAAQVAVMVD